MTCIFTTCRVLLSLLIERETPLPDALQLAGACSGSGSLDRACQATAARLERGDVPAVGKDEDWRPGEMPPMLMTCLRQAAAHEEQLRQRLSSVAGYYRRRLDVSAAWLRNIVPVALFVTVGGGTVLLYGLSVFCRWLRFIRVLHLTSLPFSLPFPMPRFRYEATDQNGVPVHGIADAAG